MSLDGGGKVPEMKLIPVTVGEGDNVVASSESATTGVAAEIDPGLSGGPRKFAEFDAG